ncbi:hypothetical protein LAUMK42_01444 [Mycobacterium persicum]|uniref:Uncharacterized protein n=1 Tax=Mycobacterium persicum TaxID=1487726 RepID=A0AB38UQC6_9MYCO|nr:hypothetical protein LAUMK15_01587 [Mycobacterium persicum]VAZ82636.1 hypothetical protein LAUMK42_01444 [Mycobacterium persicum]
MPLLLPSTVAKVPMLVFATASFPLAPTVTVLLWFPTTVAKLAMFVRATEPVPLAPTPTGLL